MLNRLGLTFAVLLLASPAWAQSGSRNSIPSPAPSGGSGTRNTVPFSAPSSSGSGTRNAVPFAAPSQSFSTPQPPFSQLPSEYPPVSSQGVIQSSPGGSCGCSVAQPQFSYAPQPLSSSSSYYSSGLSGSSCAPQPSFSPQSSCYSGSYYQPSYRPRYRSFYRSSYGRLGW